MSTDLESIAKPDSCFAVGKDCQSCASRGAHQVAALCADLSATGLEGAFQRMYPEAACAAMLSTFAQSYFESTAPLIKIAAMSAMACA